MAQPDVIIGAGRAGPTCGFDLSSCRFKVLVLEANPVVGGRTSSGWKTATAFGSYCEFPDLLRHAGLAIDDIVFWEDEVEIRLPDHLGARALRAAA